LRSPRLRRFAASGGDRQHFFGNASHVRTGRLSYANDMRTMANVLSVDIENIRTLPELAWIERDMRTAK